MQIAIPHTLDKDEVRRRIAVRIGDGAIVSGPLSLTLSWIGDDRLAVDAAAMGYSVPALLDITDTALLFDVTIPAGLGFARRTIEGLIRDRGEKLLA